MIIIHSNKNWSDIDGWWGESDAHFTSLVAQWLPNGASCAEVGTWQGRSLACMLQNVQRNGKTVTQYAIDTWGGSVQEDWQVQSVAQRGGAAAMLDQFEKNMSDCGVFGMVTSILDSSMGAVTRFADGSLDFVFIDGDHSEDEVFADITAWMPKLKPRGLIAGHDMHWPSVQAGVNKFFGVGQYVIMDNCWLNFLP